MSSEEYCGSDPQAFISFPRPHTGTVRVYAVLNNSALLCHSDQILSNLDTLLILSVGTLRKIMTKQVRTCTHWRR